MRSLAASALGLMLAGLGWTTACRKDMYDQPRYEPLEASQLFPDGASARPRIPDTVARGDLDLDPALTHGSRHGTPVDDFPLPVDLALLQRGRERYDIYCSPCHGAAGDGDGTIVQRGFPRPPSYHEQRLHDAPIGYFYNVITNGYGVMYSYASRVAPRDRWAIAAYIRALQVSREGNLDDVPAAVRSRLLNEEAAP